VEEAIAGAKWRLEREDEQTGKIVAAIMNAAGKTYPHATTPTELLGRELVKIDERPEFQPRPLTQEEREKRARTEAFLSEHAERMSGRDRD
jgi:hypothetical protein